MGRPLWFVELMKRGYKSRKLLAKMSNLPIFGRLIDKMMFEGDALVCLPKDHVIEIAKANKKLSNYINGSTIVKTIFVPNKLVNFVIK